MYGSLDTTIFKPCKTISICEFSVRYMLDTFQSINQNFGMKINIKIPLPIHPVVEYPIIKKERPGGTKQKREKKHVKNNQTIKQFPK